MTDDRDAWSAGRQLLGAEAAAERGTEADRLEQIAEDERGEQPLGLIAARDVTVAEIEGLGARQRLQAADVAEFGGRERLDEASVAAIAHLGEIHADGDEA
jgi:hypothetical protein